MMKKQRQIQSQPGQERRLAGAPGFSMIELMIVIAIGLVIAAMAVPNISRAIVTVQLRESIVGVAGLMQKTRIEAVRTNRTQVARAANVQGVNYVFVDLNQNDAPDQCAPPRCNPITTEPVVQLGRDVAPASGPPVNFTAEQLLGIFGYKGQTDSPLPFNMGFNPRGLPCTPTPSSGAVATCDAAFTKAVGSQAGFIYYFKKPSTFGDQWGAITVTPAGRVRSWVLSGTTWN